MSALRTYSHLAEAAGAAGRLPSDYEVTTSRLLYYVERGFEVATDVGRFHTRHQQAFPLVCRDWERFADPRETTYAKYVALQAARETYVDGLLDSMETATPPYDARLPPDWTAATAARLAVLRFPIHGLQMVAAYVGHMAPTGRLVTALLMQAGDELRRVQRLSRRVAGMARGRSGVAAAARDSWQNDPAWQPLRRVVERLLVTYDWAEALVALEVAVKPAFDELAFVAHAEVARAHDDHLLAEMLSVLHEDSRWQRAWTEALVRVLLAEGPGNAALIARWSSAWADAVEPALAAAALSFGEAAPAAAARVRIWRAGLLTNGRGDSAEDGPDVR